MSVDQMTLDEFKKAIAEREAKIDALEKRKRGARNYRLVIDLPLVGTPDPSLFPPEASFPLVERTAVVRKGTIFYVKEIDIVLSAVGTSNGIAVTRVIPPPVREAAVLFEYRIRDTGSDRDWQNGWVPGPILMGGNISGLRMGDAHAAVSGGSEIVVSLAAQRMTTPSSGLGMTTISAWFFQMSLSGVEVKL